MKKTPYLQSKAHRISKYVLCWLIILFIILCMCGCSKTIDPVESLTEAAHQQIVAINESLPKECRTTAIKEQLKAHDETVESIKMNCDTQKQLLNEEKMRWKWSFIALLIMVLAYFGRKAIK